jgi:hypothetical protein
MDWILVLLTQVRTTSDYGAIADLYNLQITTAFTKHFPAYALASRCLATAPISGDSSSSLAQVLLSQLPVYKASQFPQLTTQTASLPCRAQLSISLFLNHKLS